MILAVENKNCSFYKQNKIKFHNIAIIIGNSLGFCVKLYKTFLLYSARFKIILRYLYFKKLRIYNIHNTI